MNSSPEEKIEQAIAFVKISGLKILLPQIVVRENIHFGVGTTFFVYSSEITHVDGDEFGGYYRAVACDPLGATIYAATPKPSKTTLCGRASFAHAAIALDVDYVWVRGFNAGFSMAVHGPYVPRYADFDLRTHFNAEAFDFGVTIYERNR